MINTLRFDQLAGIVSWENASPSQDELVSSALYDPRKRAPEEWFIYLEIPRESQRLWVLPSKEFTLLSFAKHVEWACGQHEISGFLRNYYRRWLSEGTFPEIQMTARVNMPTYEQISLPYQRSYPKGSNELWELMWGHTSAQLLRMARNRISISRLSLFLKASCLLTHPHARWASVKNFLLALGRQYIWITDELGSISAYSLHPAILVAINEDPVTRPLQPLSAITDGDDVAFESLLADVGLRDTEALFDLRRRWVSLT